MELELLLQDQELGAEPALLLAISSQGRQGASRFVLPISSKGFFANAAHPAGSLRYLSLVYVSVWSLDELRLL